MRMGGGESALINTYTHMYVYIYICTYMYILETTRSLSRALRLPWRHGSHGDPARIPRGFLWDPVGIPLGIPLGSPGNPPGSPEDPPGIPQGSWGSRASPENSPRMPQGCPRDSWGWLRCSWGRAEDLWGCARIPATPQGIPCGSPRHAGDIPGHDPPGILRSVPQGVPRAA